MKENHLKITGYIKIKKNSKKDNNKKLTKINIDNDKFKIVYNHILFFLNQILLNQNVNSNFSFKFVKNIYNSLNRHELHVFIQRTIFNYLKHNNFFSFKEFPQVYYDAKMNLKKGYIDIYGISKDKKNKVAIEFDSGTSIKYKSVSKVLLSKANICILIVKGKEFDNKDKFINKILNNNKKRILAILKSHYKYMLVKNKDIYFISLLNNTFVKIIKIYPSSTFNCGK